MTITSVRVAGVERQASRTRVNEIEDRLARPCRCVDATGARAPLEFVENVSHRCGHEIEPEIGDAVIVDRGREEWLDPGMERLDQAVLQTAWELRARCEGITVRASERATGARGYTDEFEMFCRNGAEITDKDAYLDFLEDLGAELAESETEAAA
jgi:hypothetical protein